MLSLKTLKSASDSAKYYLNGQYYLEGKSGGGLNAWSGNGSKKLGLKGEIDNTVFEDLLKGKLPNGLQVGQEEKHRPGYDLTFSAPKSLSILVVLGKDKTALKIYRDSINKTIDWVEEKFACTRIKSQGKIQLEQTGNLCVATFEEYYSRDLDPDLHTHCIVSNVTQKEDGQWRALTGDQFYQEKMRIGMKFRENLAHELQKNGYELVQTSDQGFFELANFKKDLLRQFSKRREAIEACMSENDWKGSKMAQAANLKTRNKKPSLDLDNLEKQHKEELQKQGLSQERLMIYSSEAKKRGAIVLEDPLKKAENALESAIDQLFKNRTRIDKKELIKTALGLSLIQTQEILIEKAMESKIKEGSLLHLGGEDFSTRQFRDLEINIVSNLKKGNRKNFQIASPFLASLDLKFRTKDLELRKDLKPLITAKEKEIGIIASDPDRLVEKMNVFSKICRDRGKFVIGICSSFKDRQDFKKALDLEKCYTIEGLLRYANQHSKNQKTNFLSKNRVWLIDPNANLNLGQIEKLQMAADAFKARIVWTGLQYSTKNALILLKKYGLKTNLNSKTIDIKSAMLDAFQGIKKNENYTIIKSFNEKIQKAAQSYIENPNLNILTQNQHESSAINHLIREKLNLKGPGMVYNSLERIPLSNAEKKISSFFQTGDLIFDKESNKYFRILKTINSENNLILENNEGAIAIDLKNLKSIQVFRERNKELKIGDQIRWDSSVRLNGEIEISSGENSEIIGLNKNEVVLKTKFQKIISLDFNEPENQNWDYAYSKTIYKQGLRVSSESLCLLSSQGISRIPPDILMAQLQKSKLIVDDLNQIIENINPSMKKTALESKIESWRPDPKKSFFKFLERDLPKEFNDNQKKNQSFQLDSKTTENILALSSIDQAAYSLTEHDAVFNLKELKMNAYHESGLKVSEQDIDKAIEQSIELGWIKRISSELATTKTMLALEQESINMMRNGRGALRPVLEPGHPEFKAIEEDNYLTQGQKNAISLSLKNTDRIIGIQGVAGSGKTTMLRTLNRIVGESGDCLIGLAGTVSAKQRLHEGTKKENSLNRFDQSGVPTLTIKKFLIEANKNPSQYKNNLIVVDESSFLSNKEAYQLFKLGSNLESKIILLGDVKQLGAVEAGKIFYTLIGYGMQTASMPESLRFKDPNTRSIMQALYSHRVEDALKTIREQGRVIEYTEKEQRVQALTSLYVTHAYFRKKPTLLLTPTNEERRSLNQSIRHSLQSHAFLGENKIQSDVLFSKKQSKIKNIKEFSYSEGDIIRFNQDFKVLNFNKDSYAEVSKIDFKNKSLILRLEGGREATFSPDRQDFLSGAIEIYEKKSLALAEGEKIIWRRNDIEREIINGEKATIKKIDGNIATIVLENEKEIAINFSEKCNQHFEYAYATTVHSAQGADLPPDGITLINMPSLSIRTKNTEELKVNDLIALDPEHSLSEAQWAKIQAIDSEKLKILNTKGEEQDIKRDPKKTWTCAQNLAETKPNDLPKHIALNSFLVELTRGDQSVLVTDNLSNLEALLKLNSGLNRSAIEYIDTKWSEKEHFVEKISSLSKQPLEEKPAIGTNKTKSPTSKKEAIFFDKERILNLLNENPVDYVSLWIGSNPSKCGPTEARWGKNGSFSMITRGQKQGIWSNFEEGAAGKDLISLYAHLNQVSYGQAIKELGSNFGLEQNKQRSKTSLSKQIDLDNELKEKEKKINLAKKQYQAGRSINNTAGELYLRNRGIKSDLPSNLKFRDSMIHPETRKSVPGIIAPLTNQNGEIEGVLRIFLDKSGKKIENFFLDNFGISRKAMAKANLGLTKNNGVILNQTTSKKLLIAEGLETALSVREAMPDANVIASLSASNIANAPIPNQIQEIIICADDDGRNPASFKAIEKAIHSFLEKGYQVKIALPSKIPNQEKIDFNDALNNNGINSVRNDLKHATQIPSKEFFRQNNQSLTEAVDNLKTIQNRNMETTI